MMRRRISEEKRVEIQRLYKEGQGSRKIARQTGVSETSVYSMTKLKQRINPATGRPYKSYSEYKNNLARQETNPETNQPYKSYSELLSYQARQRYNPETGKRFGSLEELYDYQARQKTNPHTHRKFRSKREYLDYLARQKTNPTTNKLYESHSEYKSYQARQRMQRKENRRFNRLVKKGLKGLGQTRLGLAKKLGVTKRAVLFYLQGRTIPRGERLNRLLRILNINNFTERASLDDLIEE